MQRVRINIGKFRLSAIKPISIVMLLFIVFSYVPIFAQVTTQDSLKIEELLSQSHKELAGYNYDKAIKLAQESLDESNKLLYESGIINSLLLIAESYKAKGAFPIGLNNYLQALSEIEKQQDEQNLLWVNFKIGELFYDWGVPEKALLYFSKALNLNPKDIKESSKIGLLNRIAETNLRMGQYTEALNQYQELLAIYEKNENQEQKIVTLKKIASIYNQLNEHKNSLKYNFKILEINKELKDSVNTAISFNTIGFLYKALDSLSEALDYFNLALSYNRKMNRNSENDNNIVSNLINIGVINQSLGDYKSSIKSFNEALEVKKQRGSLVEVAVVHNLLASTYYNLGNYDEAIKHTSKAIELLEGSENKKMLAASNKRLSDIYQKLGDYKKALESYQKYSILKDSILYREQLAQEREQYKQYVIETTEKETKLNIIDQEMRELELRNEKVKSEKEKQDIELLLRKQELQNISLKNEQLERDKQMQKLLLQQEQIEAQRKDQAITLLEQKRDLQAIELQKNEILEKDRQKEIELQKSKLDLQESQLERGKIRQRYLIGIAVLFLLILLLILLGYFIKQRDNRILQSQYQKINTQKEHIEQINKELVQLNEEKNDLIGIVAHDLKSPLNQISGLLDIIKLTKDNLTSEQQDYMDKIFQSTKRLRNMVTKILDVNAIESKTLNLNFEETNLELLLNETINRFIELAEKKDITIQKDFEKNTALARVDNGYASEVFENLLSNSVKYSPLGTKITVKLSDSNGHLRAEFIDQGQGISKGDMTKLFGRYHKLSARPTAGEDSTGLGLSIVKKYVEAMNGKVWCESEEGKGSNFIVEFEKYRSQS